MDIQRVSIHGGHSGQFCNHAKDTLEAIIRTYIQKGYAWVGITEHMPPVSDAFVYPDEKAAGLTAASLTERFGDYIATCRRLKKQYSADIRIYVGFETETHTGSIDLAKRLIDRFQPDYVVGSAHHVLDIPFDYSEKDYLLAAERCGGLDSLYEAYFDQQYEMIDSLKPAVVGHLDIIRMYDPDYRSRMTKPFIWDKIVRNLKLIKALNLILDFNLRPLSRGDREPYLAGPILGQARDMGIHIVPGDDSHGVSDIDANMQRAINLLADAGLPTKWALPFG